MRTKLSKFIATQEGPQAAKAANPANSSVPNLHGWTLTELKNHCHPDEWEEVKDNPLALEAVAYDLRRHPFLLSKAGVIPK